jgi:glycosyltransferase involved in cell wall biosynthesis
MKHLCIDGRLIHATGIGTFLKNIFYGLSQISSLQISILFHPKDVEKLGSYSIHRRIPVKAGLYTIQEQIELPFKIPCCDLFWSPHVTIPFFPIRAKRRLTTIHDAFHLTSHSQFGFLKKNYAKLMYGSAIKLSDHISTDSHFSQSELVKFCQTPLNKLSVIHLGISPQFRKIYDDHSLANFSKRYQLPDSFLLVVGNGKPHKNLERLFAAFDKISCSESLIVVGSEKKSPKRKIRFMGFIPDEEMPLFYSLASALVFPSIYEGFGLPPLESMACGCPVIASRAASLPEICQDAVEYVDPYSIESIQSGIENVLFSEERRKFLIARGFQHVKNFSLKRSMEHYLLLIDRLLSDL